jgi:hypothetical protein
VPLSHFGVVPAHFSVPPMHFSVSLSRFSVPFLHFSVPPVRFLSVLQSGAGSFPEKFLLHVNNQNR